MLKRDEWRTNIVRSVWFAESGRIMALLVIAQMLCDADTARESLIAHGYGAEDDSLLACVANVLEREKEAL